ncbi:WG repeat-containing protein [Psychrobacter jeotgali]|uniref:WG repeat-containing protein n=1 Tax=Psychrobacter jeotgali TaxID=179010 RepID=UPI001918C7D1|nr:WG repeat-containing protein [Psychrobacter jeotgali]
MPTFFKKSTLVLSVCALLTTLPAMADLQRFEQSHDDEPTKCGFKNDNGKVVVPAKYHDCGTFSDGRARVSLRTMGTIRYFDGDEMQEYEDYVYLQGYINDAGKLVIPIKHQAFVEDMMIDYRDFSEGLLAVHKDGKYGYIDTSGKQVIPYRYKDATDFKDGVAVVSQGDKYGVIDKSGKTVVPFRFDWLDGYSDDMAKYRKNTDHDAYSLGKYGFVNRTGKIVIPAEWDEAFDFSEGLAVVKKGDYDTGQWGVIDKTGKLIVSPKYDQVYVEGMAGFVADGDGQYKNGKLDVYNFNPKGASAYDGYDSITRYTLDKRGKVLSQKTYSEWNEIEAERNPNFSYSSSEW